MRCSFSYRVSCLSLEAQTGSINIYPILNAKILWHSDLWDKSAPICVHIFGMSLDCWHDAGTGRHGDSHIATLQVCLEDHWVLDSRRSPLMLDLLICIVSIAIVCTEGPLEVSVMNDDWGAWAPTYKAQSLDPHLACGTWVCDHRGILTLILQECILSGRPCIAKLVSQCC